MAESSLTDSDATEATTLKPVKELPVIQDEGFFTHSTGDTYDGFFEATKKTRTIKMNGHGVYVTAEGDHYTGQWENDKLGGTEEATIAFVDGSTYVGHIKDFCFSGSGKYLYPDSSVLTGDFVENSPHGHMKLIDPNGHTWLGKAEQGFGWFDPENHFYAMLEKKDPVKSKMRGKASETQD